MMKLMHNLISIGVSAVLLLLGWFLVAGFFGVRYPFGEFLFSAPAGRLVLGLLFIAAVVFYWLTAIPAGRKPERFLSFEGEGGTVSISVKAVNDFLMKLGREFAGIINLRSEISGSGRDGVEIRLDLSVNAGTKIQEMSQLLQQRVRDSLRDNLGISDVAAVKISVIEIAGAQDNARPEREEWQSTL